MSRTKKWDEMSRYEMFLARQVPEPEWYPAVFFWRLYKPVRNKTDPIARQKGMTVK